MNRLGPRWVFALIIVLVLAGGAVASAQDGTTLPTEPAVDTRTVTELRYGDFAYAIDETDGTVAVGFVEARNITNEGTTLDVVLFVHDTVGWRPVGVLTGEAVGPLQGAAPGQVVTLSVVGGEVTE